MTKELLSAILGPIQEFIPEEHRVRYCFVGDFDDWKDISTTDLAALAKDWVIQFKLILYSGRMLSDGDFSYSCFIPESCLKPVKRLYASTEAEAILKMAEWILEKEINGR